MNQLVALRNAIHAESVRDCPDFLKIAELKDLYRKCSVELAEVEVQEWKRKNPLAYLGTAFPMVSDLQ